MNLTTEAGRRLFTDVDPMDMWESNGVTPADIAAIEAEAREQERERIATSLAVLRDVPHSHEGEPCTACLRDGAIAAITERSTPDE